MLPTYDTFKAHLKSKLQVPDEYYYYGERWASVHHARMRIGCSKLNSDLCYNLHVINNPTCQCGAPSETSYHYLFECPLFANERVTMFNTISHITRITLKVLLFGKSELTLDQNQTIFEAVHTFIKSTQRFN